MNLRSSSSPQTLFMQIYDYLDAQLKEGVWQEHDKLPSVRHLAEELGVHRLTVLRAYQLLKDSGRVYVKEKSGYYVLPLKQLTDQGSEPVPTKRQPFIQRGLPLLPGIGGTASGYLQDMHMIKTDASLQSLSFAQALVDPGLLPNRYFSEYAKKVFDLYPKVLGTYSSVQGDAELRTVLAQHLAETHRLYLGADDIMITNGAQQAIDLLARAVLSPGDTVLIEQPTYHSAIDIFKHQGARIVPVKIHPWGYDLDEVEKLMQNHQPRLFYLNPTFHNPTGYTVPTLQRKRLAELAEQYRCLLAEDDPFRDIYFHTAPPPPVASYDTEGWVVYIRSFSKYAAPGLRIAALCAGSPLMEQLLSFKYRMDNGAALLNQKVFLLYLASERLTGHLEKLRIALDIRKQIMEEELAPARKQGWTWESPQGGLNLWIKLPEDGPEMNELAERCARHGVYFSAGSSHDPSGQPNRHIRLSYSYVNEVQIRDGIRHLVREGLS
ncbi:GntR family transcriptional regulator [Paenibacillus yonginensis]|uniref:GntR family transcriptional regulator n=1 Tax=Paenibacillus yonginensis TaxID=1462996 RepID=A0A1B1MYW4_9BACL|nr:PLP-dependent aminotransferase family protein [Paenibacillus yonginensis]ANS74363.1 GntR family transcriptional regulator [Paenibacillus yonginensis]